MKLQIRLEVDRLEVAKILIRNGYTVRQAKEKRAGKNSYYYYLEVEQNENTGE